MLHLAHADRINLGRQLRETLVQECPSTEDVHWGCYSARRFDADRRANPLRPLDTGGQISAPNNNTARAATGSEVTDLQREARELKEVVAEQALDLRLLKKTCSRMGKTGNEIPGLR